MFSCKFCEISKNNFSTEHLQESASTNTKDLLRMAASRRRVNNFVLTIYNA